MSLHRMQRNAVALSLATLAAALLMFNCGVQDLGTAAHEGVTEEVMSLDVPQGKADNVWGVKKWTILRSGGELVLLGLNDSETGEIGAIERDDSNVIFQGYIYYLGPEQGLRLDYVTRTGGERNKGEVRFDKDLRITSEIDRDSGLEILTVLNEELQRQYRDEENQSCIMGLLMATVVVVTAYFTAGYGLGTGAAPAVGLFATVTSNLAACYALGAYTKSQNGDNDKNPAGSLAAPPEPAE